MQASKIIVGGVKVYAIKIEGQLKRFRPTAVLSKRTGEGPANCTNMVQGRILHDDDSVTEITVRPDDVLGEYQQYQELVAQEAKVKADRAARATCELAARESACRALYRLCGVTAPDNLRTDGIFRVSYGGVEISQQGCVTLLKTLSGSEA